jgi:hypothetical protein
MYGFEFTLDGRRYRIGPRTSLKWVDRQRAAVLVARAARSHWSIHGRLADWFRFERRLFAAGYDMSDPAVIDRLIHTIESGMLHVEELPALPRPIYSHRLPSRDERPPPTQPEAIDEPVEPAPALAVVDMRVIEANGRPVAGVMLELGGDGLARTTTTGSGGVHRFHDIEPGSHGLRVVSIEDAAWDTDIRRSPDHAERVEPLEGERNLDVALELVAPPSSSFTVETGVTHCLVFERPVLRFVVPDVLRFDHGSGLLVPAPWTNHRHPLAGIVHALIELLDQPEWWLLVVGHASAPGSDASNQTLSEHRADVIRALVEHDGPAWVEHAQKRGSLRDVMAYLDYLGTRRAWLCVSAVPVAELGTAETSTTRATVSAFQDEYNARFDGALLVDGVCGKKTLAAIFEVLYDEFERWLTKLGTSPAELPLERVRYAGYGATLAGRQGAGAEAEAADRIVDLVLVEGVSCSPEIGPAEIYGSKIAWRLPFELPHEPDEWATGPLTIVTDLTPDEPADPETYRLSTDGDLYFERVLPDEGTVEHGELVLHFEALPTDHRYTLVVVASNGRESLLFEGLSYSELHGASPGKAENRE